MAGPKGSAEAKYKADTPPPSVTGTAREYIGVQPDQVGYLPRAPRYYLGREAQPSRWTVEQRADLQEKMRRAGIYGKDWASVRQGQWSGIDREAYSILLGEANMQGETATDLLGRLIATGPSDADLAMLEGRSGARGSGAGPPKFSAQVIHPDDAKIGVERIASEVYGFRPDEETLSRIVSAFQNEQVRAQQQQWNTSISGGTAQAAPDLGTFAEKELRSADPNAAQGHDVAKVFSDFLGIIGQAGMGRM